MADLPAGVVVEKEACSKCGADVREGTIFCYACGNRVADDAEANANASANGVNAAGQAALDELAEKLRADEKATTDDKLAKAATERKKARVSQRKGREFVWEPRDDMPATLVIAAIVFLVGAIFVVAVTVVWK